jgi:hypothetical protein
MTARGGEMNVIAIAIETSTRAIATIGIAIETLGEEFSNLLCRMAGGGAASSTFRKECDGCRLAHGSLGGDRRSMEAVGLEIKEQVDWGEAWMSERYVNLDRETRRTLQ